jgi:hypothetical protein
MPRRQRRGDPAGLSTLRSGAGVAGRPSAGCAPRQPRCPAGGVRSSCQAAVLTPRVTGAASRADQPQTDQPQSDQPQSDINAALDQDVIVSGLASPRVRVGSRRDWQPIAIMSRADEGACHEPHTITLRTDSGGRRAPPGVVADRAYLKPMKMDAPMARAMRVRHGSSTSRAVCRFFCWVRKSRRGSGPSRPKCSRC